MYIPDRGLLKRMQRYDPKLNVKWASARQRWQVTRLSPAPSRLYEVENHIMFLENDDGSYRPFDERCFRLLRAVDHHQRKTEEIIEDQVREQKAAHISSMRQQKADMDDIVGDPIHWAAKKDAESFGAINMPKEDVVKALEPRYKDVEDEVAYVDKF